MQHSSEELQEILKQMRMASAQFYVAAVRCGNHAFIEFTGLMNEYITVCEELQGDFTQANVHGDTHLPFQEYHIAYIREKLECIFGDALLEGSKVKWKAFLAEVHTFSRQHKDAVLASKQVGCFYCINLLLPSAITEWCDGGSTAICPRCGIDAILPESSVYYLKPSLLARMHLYAFCSNESLRNLEKP